MKKAKVSYEVERKKYEVLEVHSFSSSRKRMSKIILNGEHQEILVKGASEIVIKSCTDWYNMETN